MNARQAHEAEVTIQRACEVFHVERDSLLGDDRRADAAWCRQVVCYALRRLKWHTTDIAEVVRRDHSTVSHAIQRVERRIRVSGVDREAVAVVTGEISMVQIETAAAVADIRAAIDQLHDAMAAGMRLLERYERSARTIREGQESPVLTRGAA